MAYNIELSDPNTPSCIQKHTLNMASNLRTNSAPNLADVERARATGTLHRRDPQLIWRTRTQTHDKQHAETVGARKPPKLPPYGLNIGAGKPFPKQMPAADTYVVEFNDADDPLHPQNWALRRKYAPSTYSTISKSLILLM